MAEAALKKLGWDEVCEAVSQHGSTALGQIAAKRLLLPDTRQGTERLLAETHAVTELE
eukprot:CAMPEP_0118952528 /NCGR_PEP_ID=MMETSP1169-20130426/55011_1 /TAXON_ID=36882 /ORGANISM="Pyramimonas obovata, Strain CCMP722" /LENGTH=57 /DNA_ID=CAMNT_0006899811 /DNA_START=340 /DNA_END=510 /DNA_ORIENTATION=+